MGSTAEDMARERTQRAATVGVAEHGNSAVLVTVAPGGEFLDRRRCGAGGHRAPAARPTAGSQGIAADDQPDYLHRS